MSRFNFIICLHHPDSCSSYESTSVLLKNTLRSVCNQDTADFRVTVVCNALPEPRLDDRTIDYVLVDFPPPETVEPEKGGIEFIRIDKGTKYFAGLLHCRQYNPSHVMLMDADDFVSRRLARHVLEHPVRTSWYINLGFVYHHGEDRVYPITGFNRSCGTSNILQFGEIPPVRLPENPTREQILHAVDPRFIKFILGSHKFLADSLRKQNRPIAPIPFPGAVYYLAHGTNVSRNEHYSKYGVKPVPLTDEIRAEFTLPF